MRIAGPSLAKYSLSIPSCGTCTTMGSPIVAISMSPHNHFSFFNTVVQPS
jgi:hypothetical protein